MAGIASSSIFFNKAIFNGEGVKRSIIVQSIIYNKVAKPFLTDIKAI